MFGRFFFWCHIVAGEHLVSYPPQWRWNLICAKGCAVCLYNEQEPPFRAVLFWQTDVCFYDRSGGLSGGSFLEVE